LVAPSAEPRATPAPSVGWFARARRLGRLLTWKRATRYGAGLCALYLALWLSLTVRSTPPLNGNREPIGGDYIAFYAAGRLLLDGQAAALYDHDTVVAVQAAALEQRVPGFYDAFRNPAFFALVFVPLAPLGLVAGAYVWLGLSLALLAVALRLLLDEVPELRSRWRGLAVLVFAFPPVFFCLIDGQNATLSLLLYVLIYRAFNRGQDGASGVWAALGLFKPQLFFIFPLVFAAAGRWRALGAYCATAALLALVSVALVGPAGIAGWLRILVAPETANAAGNAWRMHAVRTFFDLLVPGQPVLTLALSGLVSAGLAAGVLWLWRRWGADATLLPLLWSLTVLVAVAIDPHIVDYDLTVLTLAAALACPASPALRWWLLGLSVLLLFRAQVPLLGGAAFQITVPLLLVCAYVVWTELRARLTAPPRPA
jgi:alpha-1,2-mannosyltransferase